MTNVFEQWNVLCREFEAARDAQFAAYAAVTRGFARVARSTGGNPSMEELEEYKNTSQRLDDIKRRMDEFVKANT